MRELSWIYKKRKCLFILQSFLIIVLHLTLFFIKFSPTENINNLMIQWLCPSECFMTVCVCMCACHRLCVGVTESTRSFYHTSPRDWAWVIRLGIKCLYSWIMSPDSLTWSFSCPIGRTDTFLHQHLLPIDSVGAAKWSSERLIKLLRLVLYQVWSLGLSIFYFYFVLEAGYEIHDIV